MAHAFSIQLICRALGMLASVFSVAMSARYLGPGPYGQLTMAVAFVGMWNSFADLGVATVIVRRCLLRYRRTRLAIPASDCSRAGSTRGSFAGGPVTRGSGPVGMRACDCI